jgi:SM-20-related protein
LNDLHSEIIAAIADSGCYVGRSIFPTEITDGLRARLQLLHASGALTEAQVGRAATRNESNPGQREPVQRNPSQRAPGQRWRGDDIKWLDDLSTDPMESAAIAAVNALRLALNATLFIGALDTELHFARYAHGTFYKTHLDRFGSNNTRVISLVFYLNESWICPDGGELVIYDAQQQPLHRVIPCSGTMVAFLSERFAHEVLPTQTTRLSMTGWMRRRALGTS